MSASESDPGSALDSAELCALLALCFPSSSEILARRPFIHEPPEERFVVRDGDRLVAHAALRERPIRTERGWMRIAGISEVCVHPDARGRGHARRVLAAAHERAAARSLRVALLFGSAGIYASSGYVPAANVFRYWDPRSWRWIEARVASALVRCRNPGDWPAGEIRMNGVLY